MAILTLYGCEEWNFDVTWPREKAEHTVYISEAFPENQTLIAKTSDGLIHVAGEDTDTCDITARIVAHAHTAQQAQEMAAKTHIELITHGDHHEVKVHKPRKRPGDSIDVHFEITIPHKTSVNLRTSDGHIVITQLQGSIQASSSDGDIHLENATGTITLKASDGHITCQNIAGPQCTLNTSDGGITVDHCDSQIVRATTSDGRIQLKQIKSPQVSADCSDGSIELTYAPDAVAALNTDLCTSDGSITLTLPEEVSAHIKARCSDGSIHTQRPILRRGHINKSLNGVLGDGQGRIVLRTSDGSIHIR